MDVSMKNKKISVSFKLTYTRIISGLGSLEFFNLERISVAALDTSQFVDSSADRWVEETIWFDGRLDREDPEFNKHWSLTSFIALWTFQSATFRVERHCSSVTCKRTIYHDEKWRKSLKP